MTALSDELRGRIAEVRRSIEAAARAAGRSPSDILFCAASKTQPPETVTAAAALDIDLFGENRVQELIDKYDAGAYLQKPVHMIGHLQTNKVRQTVGRAAMIESVDSLRLLTEISAEAEKKRLIQDILVEINIAGEESKSGIAPGDAERLIEAAESLPNVAVCGLMAIPPAGIPEAESRRYFAEMRKQFERIASAGYKRAKMTYLSMGMSADYTAAITEGANIVRVGTAIFGARNYPV
jgi:pyridoxal phosphate enzyme (YggS family)